MTLSTYATSEEDALLTVSRRLEDATAVPVLLTVASSHPLLPQQLPITVLMYCWMDGAHAALQPC